MTQTAFVSFILYVLINAFTPGPGNILALNTASNYEWKKAKRLYLGIFVGYYIVQIICAIFVYEINELLSPFLLIIKYIGIAYMIFIAVCIATSKPTEKVNEKSASFTKGFLLQFVNVKIYLFGITALSVYVVEYYSTFGTLILFELIIATVGTIATLTWIAVGHIFQRIYLKHFRIINIIMGLLLLECTITFIL